MGYGWVGGWLGGRTYLSRVELPVVDKEGKGGKREESNRHVGGWVGGWVGRRTYLS